MACVCVGIAGGQTTEQNLVGNIGKYRASQANAAAAAKRVYTRRQAQFAPTFQRKNYMQFLRDMIFYISYFFFKYFLLLQFKMGDLSDIRRKSEIGRKGKKTENKFSWRKRKNLFGGQR